MDTVPSSLVSIIVPCYNVAPTLDQALGSLCAQTYTNLEIIAVNDASTDETPAKLDKWAQGDARIQVIHNVQNCGYGASMNKGLSAAQGSWIGILEPDDWVLPTMVETLVGAAEAAVAPGRADVAGAADVAQAGGGAQGAGAADVVQVAGAQVAQKADAAGAQVAQKADAAGTQVAQGEIEVIKAPYIRVSQQGAKQDYAQCAYRFRVQPVGTPFRLGEENVQLLRQHPSIWSALYRKAFLDKANIRFPEHPGSGWADNEFFYRTLLEASNIVYVDEPFYCYCEDSTDQEQAALRAHPTLALQRWIDLDNILKTMPEQGKPVLLAHTLRAFDYLASTLDAVGEADERIAALQQEVFDRLDPALVAEEGGIAPRLKEQFAHARGLAFDKKQARRLYTRYRRKEFTYMIKSNGPGFALRHLVGYVTR